MSKKVFSKEEIVKTFLEFETISQKIKEVKEFLGSQHDSELPKEVKRTERKLRSYPAASVQYVTQVLKNEGYAEKDFMTLLTPAKMEKAVDKGAFDKTAKHIQEKTSYMYKVKV